MNKKEKNSRFQWPYGALALLLLLGMGAAFRLTWHHETLIYGKQAASIGLCPENQTISCDLVNTSTYSELWGIPIALFAIPTYLFLLGLIFFRHRWTLARTLIVYTGLGTSLYSLFLAGISVWELGFACLWCIFLYFVNIGALVFGVIGKKQEQPEPLSFQLPKLLGSFASFSLLVFFAVFIQKNYRALLIHKNQSFQEKFTKSSVESEKQSLIGKCLPPTTLKDIRSGSAVSLIDPTSLQKPIFLIFWSATCGHCRKEMPKLSQFIKRNPDLFHWVTVSTLRPQKKVGELSHREFTLKFANEIELKAPILNDPGILAPLLQVAGTPSSFLLAPNGQVMKIWKGMIPELDKSLTLASRSLASLAPEPCSENLITTQTQMHDWLLFDSEQNGIRLKSLISSPTIVLVRSQASEFKGSEWNDFLKFSKRMGNLEWKVLLVSLGNPQTHPPLSFPFYFTTEATSSPGVYLVASNGALVKSFSGPLNWDNPTFQEQVFAWLKNS